MTQLSSPFPSLFAQAVSDRFSRIATMSQQISYPRITSAYLDNYANRHITIVGKVTQLRGSQATIDSEGSVTVLLNRDSHLINGNTVQIIGKVNPDLTVKVQQAIDLGTNVNMNLYAHVVKVTHKYKNLFVFDN